MQRVLMVDDDVELCEMMADYLGGEGFAVSAVHDGPAGVEGARNGDYQLVLLDVMLPGFDGFEVLRRVRASENEITPGAQAQGAHIPVLMLTARGDAEDRVVGLEVGADDYLPKPFDERELVARMRAILRRAHAPSVANAETARDTLRVGDVHVDCGSRLAVRASESLVLTAVEFDLLVMLMRAPGKAIDRNDIAREVFDRKLLPFDRSIDTHISHVRRKLGAYSDGTERIKTVRGVGYVYVLPVELESR